MAERKITCEFELAADVEQVWAAITEAEHICHWFAPFVTGQTGEGGYIDLSWVDPNNPMRLDIIGWEPKARLQTTWHSAPAGTEPINLPLEITLEATSEHTTRLKLVQNGFLSDESWDDEFQSHSRGWNTELRHLKYYVEHQFSRSRAYFFEKLSLNESVADIANFVGPGGVLIGDLRSVKEGDTFSIQVEDGTKWQCQLIWQFATTDLVFLCDTLDGGIIRLAVETMSGSPELWCWAFSYSLSEEDLAQQLVPVVERFRQKLQVFQQAG